MITLPELLSELRTAFRQAGSMKAWAEKHGFSSSYLCEVLKGNRNPGQRLLDAMGYERVKTVEYRRKDTA